MVSQGQVKRKISFSSYFAILSFTILIFLLGTLFGNFIAGIESKSLSFNQQNLIIELDALDLKSTLINEGMCNFSLKEILDERSTLGANLEALETRIGKTDEQIILQKQIYELVELKTFLLLDKYSMQCNKNYTIILFFYTNKEKDSKGRIEASDDQGYILSQLNREYLDKVHIFSFDINLKNPAVDTLIEKYQIQNVPALVINNALYGYKTLAELKELVNKD
jgi:hypothetical protein